MISAREILFYMVNDIEIRLIRKESLDLPTDHNKGGQSSGRFGRIHANKRHRHHLLIAEWLLEEYYNSENNSLRVLGLIVGGPADTKTHVIQTDIFQKYLSDHVVSISNTPEFNDRTANLLYHQSKDLIEKFLI